MLRSRVLDRTGARHGPMLRLLLTAAWCVASLGTPLSAQILIEDSEAPIKKSEERESKEEATESPELQAFSRRGHRHAPSTDAVRAPHTPSIPSAQASAAGRRGHALPNGLLAPLTC